MKIWPKQLAKVLAALLVLSCFASVHVGKAAASGPDIVDDFSTTSGLWTMLGAATRSEGAIELTPDEGGQTGTLWLNESISPPYAVDFRFKNKHGTWSDGADGLVFMFNKKKNTDAISGGGMGFEPGNGYGIEFDTWWNEEYDDPEGPGHIALIKHDPETHLRWVNQYNLEDGNWHDARVVVDTDEVTVYMDGQRKFSYAEEFGQSTDYGIGFAASTGALHEQHLLDDVRITRSTFVKEVVTQAVYGQPGDVVSIDVTFNSPVDVTGTPVLHLIPAGTAVYNGGGGTDTLHFSYTVEHEDEFADLNYASIHALDVSGGQAVSSNGVPANVTLPPSGIGILRSKLTFHAPKDLQLDKGDDYYLQVEFNQLDQPPDQLPEDVTYSTLFTSSDSSIVTVDSSGYLSAESVGNAVITARYGNMTAKLRVTVVKNKTGLSFGPSVSAYYQLLTHGASHQLQVFVEYDDGTREDISTSASYELMGETDSLTVNSAGLLKAGSQDGYAFVAVTYEELSLGLYVIVRKIDYIETIDPFLLLKEGRELVLPIRVFFEENEDDEAEEYEDELPYFITQGYTLHSTNTDVVSTDGNTLVVNGQGSAAITATIGGFTQHISTVVVPPAKPDFSFVMNQIILKHDVTGDDSFDARDARLLLQLMSNVTYDDPDDWEYEA